MAAGHSLDVDPGRWQTGLEELLGRIAGRFGRVEPRWRARAFVCGLLADLPRKNCWTIAEHAGDANPDGMQHLLGRAVWDHDGVRDDLRAYVTEALGDPAAVLVIDETGDLKKGSQSVGVQRQDTGTAGRIENAQVAVYLVYASEAGHALIDRELYVPRGWIADPDRCRGAGIPEEVGFATKPALVRRNRRTGELAFYRCWTPRPVLLATLVRVAGRRWTIEERFQTGKGLVGLDQHQVRRWRSWYRWVTLAMLAHAVLVVLAATDRTRHPPPAGLISLTCNEVQHLFAALVTRPAGDLGHRLRWSVWRRRHQARARIHHYRRQANGP